MWVVVVVVLVIAAVVVAVAVAAAAAAVSVWVIVAEVVAVIVVHTRLYMQATHTYFSDAFHTHRVLKQDPLSQVFSSLQNATMTNIRHWD